jgi:hephaestin
MVQGAEFKHSGKTRIYYVRAEEIDWDYVPKGKNLISGEDFTPDETLFYDVREQGSVFKKCVYRGFTDATYSKRLPHPEHMGQLGPVLYAEV